KPTLHRVFTVSKYSHDISSRGGALPRTVQGSPKSLCQVLYLASGIWHLRNIRATVILCLSVLSF
ncbi:hypothetical protein OAE40_02005, partial [Rubripirellula sp.]